MAILGNMEGYLKAPTATDNIISFSVLCRYANLFAWKKLNPRCSLQRSSADSLPIGGLTLALESLKPLELGSLRCTVGFLDRPDVSANRLNIYANMQK